MLLIYLFTNLEGRPKVMSHLIEVISEATLQVCKNTISEKSKKSSVIFMDLLAFWVKSCGRIMRHFFRQKCYKNSRENISSTPEGEVEQTIIIILASGRTVNGTLIDKCGNLL